MSTLSKPSMGFRNRHFFIIDALFFVITPFCALVICLDLDTSNALDFPPFSLLLTTEIFLIVKLLTLYFSGLYKHYWRYADLGQLWRIAVPITVAVLLHMFLLQGIQYIAAPIEPLPRSLPLIDGLLSFVAVGGVRFGSAAIDRRQQFQKSVRQGHPALVVGAGSAGVTLVQQMQRHSQLDFYPVAFIDDDPQKHGLQILGLPVLGGRYKIPEVVCRLNISRVIIAIPSAPGRIVREIVDICQTAGAQTSTVPGLYELLSNRIRIDHLRDIQIEDLLRRTPIQTDVQKVFQFLKGKRVLITGAGGSIGSELCRQVLKCHPAEMILLGKGENSVFLIQQELEQVVQQLKKQGEAQGYTPQLTIFITDIRCQSRLEYAFVRFKPEIIFHAAAHKHVPLMELNSPEAITSNVLGTKNLLDMALKYDVKHFVMISTDKAVNPTSVMGASKRVAEMLMLQAARSSGHAYVVVRFGNVLGSRGSVVPTFQHQIAGGGPLTITHPEICRYFMTIPEAVQLVLQASVLGKGGEVMMLDMGQPVKIVDLAKDLIHLSGYEVGRDIDIVFTGLRPGEKLFEELFIPGETYERTQHEKILIVRNASKCISQRLNTQVATLCDAAHANDANAIVSLLQQVIPEYQPASFKPPIESAKPVVNAALPVRVSHRV